MHSKLLLFTDLDGTLLGHRDYDCIAAFPVLAQLRTLQIPVIPVTSKTHAEVTKLRSRLGLTDPFIVENGGGVFIPVGDRNFPNAIGTVQAGHTVVELGLTYAQARQALQQLAAILNTKLLGFGDMTIAQLQQYTGLTAADAAQAQTRDFSEPFVTPQHLSGDRLRAAVADLGLQVVVGDRFSHLIGARSGKGQAVKRLVEQYQTAHPNTQIFTVGLGNSPNDIAMLAVVDVAIVVPGEAGVHVGLRDRGWRVAPAPAPEGWARVVSAILAEQGWV